MTYTRSISAVTRLPLMAFVAMLAASAYAEEPSTSLAEKVGAAYADIDVYAAKWEATLLLKQGRWDRTQAMEGVALLDQEHERLLLRQGEMNALWRDGSVWFTANSVEGRHVKEASPWAPTYDTFTQGYPVLASAPQPDLAFMFADNPAAALSLGEAQSFTEDLDAGTLTVPTPRGTLVLQIDLATHRIASAVEDFDLSKVGGQPGDTMSMAIVFDERVWGEAIDADRFVMDGLDEAVSQAYSSLAELVASMQPQHGLTGQPAPAINTTVLGGAEFKLAEVQAKVILLDFWATWCPPCVQGLPKIDAIHAWAEAEGKDVAVYGVNVGESEATVAAFVKQQGLDLPMILDTQNAASQAYQANSIPQTVLIADGKVQKVFVGLAPDLEATLKAEIERLLSAN